MSVHDERDVIEVKLQVSIWEEEKMSYQTPQLPITIRVMKAITYMHQHLVNNSQYYKHVVD